MITAIVAAIAITQREARREKEAKEAEEAEARKKSIVVVGAGLAGLFAALLCRAQGFTVTVVEAKHEKEFLDHDDGIVWLAPNALRVLERVDEKISKELKEAACHIKKLHYRRYKSGKSIATTNVGEDLLAFAKPDLQYLLIGFCTATFRLGVRIVSYHDAPEDLDGPLPHGKPYALSSDGEKFYADCIVSTEDIARTHVLASAGEEGLAEIDTKWTATTGSVMAEDLTGNKLLGDDRADVWVGEESYITTLTSDGELVFTAYDLDANNEGELLLDELVEGWDPDLVAAVTHASVSPTSKRVAIRQKPGSLVSRKSRKLLLFGDAGFTFPLHSDHLEYSYHVEAASTLAVCLRKAASVPLGLEVYTRIRNPRYAKAMMMAQDRFNTITGSAADGELEATELQWEVGAGAEGGGEGEEKEESWWEYDAEKFAEKNFDGVIDVLTAELLGKQKAMMEAQARAQAEAEAKAKMEQEAKSGEESNGGQEGEIDKGGEVGGIAEAEGEKVEGEDMEKVRRVTPEEGDTQREETDTRKRNSDEDVVRDTRAV
ncbi:hypothetical protein K440DRAFT_664746, partial [Wilcoxina mikolae CBS 423.85]